MNEPKIRFKGFRGEWEEKKLGATALSICSGKSNNVPGPYPLYGSTGVIGTTDKNIYRGIKLLVARVGANAGHLQLVNIDCGVSDNTLIIQLDGELSYTYLLYFFLHYKLNRFIYGSGQPLITGGMLKQVSIFFGNIREREMIATYFLHLDALIQSTTKKIESLKQVKAASLQSMFPQEGETTPRVRFKGFEGEWEKVAVSTLLEERREFEIMSDEYPLKAFIAYVGVSEKGERYDRSSLVNDVENKVYKKTDLGDFIYSSNNLETGSIGLNKYGKATISPVYSIFKCTEKSYSGYIGCAFTCKDFINKMVKWRQGVMYGQWRIHESDFLKIDIFVPSFDEQRCIGNYFTNLDRQINLQSQRLEKLKQIKAACLDKMFV